MRGAVGIIICLIGWPLSAQWLNYPTAGIPRLADGKPNLTAPTPRTADGKPDLSGIWGLACPVANAVNGTVQRREYVLRDGGFGAAGVFQLRQFY